MAQSSAKATPIVSPLLIRWTTSSKASDQKVAEQTALGKSHTRGTSGGGVTVVVSHVTVEEVLMVPSNDPWVSTNSGKATLYVLESDGIKFTPYVEKGRETVRPCIDVVFDIIREGGGSSLS